MDAVQFDRIVAILIGLILVPGIAEHLFLVVSNLFNWVGSSVRRLSELAVAVDCSTEVGSCAKKLAADLGEFLAWILSRFIGAFQLSQFPAAGVVWFLLIVLISNQVIRFVHKEFDAGNAPRLYASINATFSRFWRRRVIFALLIVSSFYLGLCALLAIPLFQDKTKVQWTEETLDKDLEQNMLKQDVFDKSFPETLPAIPEGGVNVVGSKAGLAAEVFSFERGFYAARLRDLQTTWSAARTSTYGNQTRWRNQAKLKFKITSDGVGKRQAADHYENLSRWHQRLTTQSFDALQRCRDRVNALVSNVLQSTSNTKSRIEATFGENAGPSAFTDTLDRLGNPRSAIQSELSETQANCSATFEVEQQNPPERPSFADALGELKPYTKWLLDPQQMPLVIIVGLVGFSLLGATVSRVVRAPQTESAAALPSDDLLIVIAGGTTAAVVVFLAAYGGLAVLGGAGGDPNPYVVFMTCLIAAVYSEDVWHWARGRLAFRSQRASAERARKNTRRGKGRQRKTETRRS